MPLQKLQFRPGIIRDTTSLANEGGWYSCDKVRFRQGNPEKIGGWQRLSANTYLGVCRTLSMWRTQIGNVLTGVGTHLKMYIENGGTYNDVTPLRSTTVIAANAFTTSNGSAVVKVNQVAHGGATGDYVTLSGSASAVGGIPAATFNGEFVITYFDANTYQVTVGATASSNATGGNTTAAFQLAVGSDIDTAVLGAWGAGGWGSGVWGTSGGSSAVRLRLWNQVPYGDNLLLGQRGGAPYQWSPNATPTIYDRAVAVSSLGGASNVPLYQNYMLLEQSSRIMVLFGTNGYGTTTIDPLLVRWSDAGSVVQWTPSITTQAGEYRLLAGAAIVAAFHTRQDILVLTDTAAYVMQYVGPPYVFGFTQQSDNISVAGPMAATSANGVVYWMGTDKFYFFDGRVRTLTCPISDEVFDNWNTGQAYQTISGTNEGFDEVWWYYCSTGQNTPDRYVIFNYTENLWAYGSLSRTAWLDGALKAGPVAATTSQNIVIHEVGNDDGVTGTAAAVSAFIESADFDIGDGDRLAHVRSAFPDITFTGSDAVAPAGQLTVRTRNNPGSAHNTETTNTVARVSTSDVEQWTPQVFLRARGRVMSIRFASTGAGVRWKVGTPRIDVRPDGRRS